VLALAGERPGVGVVEAAQRFVVRREVASGVVGAAPEDVARPAGATWDEVAVVVLRALDLERERFRRRGPVAADVIAVGVPGAPDERPELAASTHKGAFAALRADLTRPGLGRRLLPGEWP